MVHSKAGETVRKKPCHTFAAWEMVSYRNPELLQMQCLEAEKPSSPFLLFRCDYLIKSIDLHGKESDLVVQLE